MCSHAFETIGSDVQNSYSIADVWSWHSASKGDVRSNVGYWEISGPIVLNVSSSPFDPTRTSASTRNENWSARRGAEVEFDGTGWRTTRSRSSLFSTHLFPSRAWRCRSV